MNVLMVAIKFPPYFAGAAVQATYLAKELQKKGIGVQFITDNDERPTVNDVYEGLPVYRFSTFSAKDSFMKQLLYVWRIFWYALRNRKKFDIVHFHSMRGIDCTLVPLMKMLGFKVVLKLTLVGYDDPMAFRNRKMWPLYKRCIAGVDKFAAISTKLQELSIAAGVPANKVEIIYNGVNTERFSRMALADKEEEKKRLGFSDYLKVFISVGKVERRKGYDFLLQAWKDISLEFHPAALLIAGPGNNEDNPFYLELLETCRKSGFKNVHFLGQTDKVEDYIRISDAFLFCSRTEGFGTVLIEAMSACVPVVATNIPGVTEDIIKDPEIGRIDYSGKPEEFAKLVTGFLKHSTATDVRVASGSVRGNFDIRNIAEQYVDMYRILLGQGTEVLAGNP